MFNDGGNNSNDFGIEKLFNEERSLPATPQIISKYNKIDESLVLLYEKIKVIYLRTQILLYKQTNIDNQYPFRHLIIYK